MNPELEPKPSNPAQLLNAQEVAERLGVSDRWVRDHATRRFPKLPVIKLGSLLRFDPEDVSAFIEAQRDNHSGTKRRQ
ncbi:MAG TPA: helix-turn-helix domain-containing protein [Terriglobales bacterium]|nr:helix-turn-helix domain-containing protein [Terriglobales bacterium]